MQQIGVPLEGFAAFTRKAAAEGMVLLKNENQMLPLREGEQVAIFGRSQIDTYKNGTGSGGAVNVAYSVNILQGMRNQVILDEEVAQTYEIWRESHPFDNGGGAWAAEPWHQKEMPLSQELLQRASSRNKKAFVVIGRTAGEDQDNGDVAGSYRFTEEEMDMLVGVCQYFKQVAVILNVSNIIDMSWMKDERIQSSLDAVLYMWQAAMEGGNALADVLTGKENPSGKLADTIAYDIQDYPSTKNYGNAKENVYEEDIYVGYRYFETFAKERVLFPFGYGLSYTDFEITQRSAVWEEQGQSLQVLLSVKNIGLVAGKEVVQIYMEAPQGKLGKAKRVLVGFAKTDCLQAQQEQMLKLSIPVQRMVSYDDSGVTGNKSSWVLEAGEYHFYLGTDCRSQELLKIDGMDTYSLKELFVLEKLEEALAPMKAFQRMYPRKKEDGSFAVTYQPVPTYTVDLEQRILERLPEQIPFTQRGTVTLEDVAEKRASLEAFIGQMDKEMLATLVRGEGMSSPKVTAGTAAAFGGVGDDLLLLGIPIACAADGPSGIRMEGGAKATQLPIGTLLACTWNIPLIEELYEWEGQELLRNQIDTLLGPGMNIRRNPLNGRNFEYYSEDPLLTGEMAAATVRGIKKGGSSATLKHFACNSQEAHRHQVNALVSERALREIYLKGFEIAVKEGQANSIMSSYNPVNGYWAASNYDLLTTILRGQWGFHGIVMTDWWAMMNDVMKGGEPSKQDTRSMVRAQNDLYMVVPNDGAKINAMEDNTLDALARGDLTVGELQRAAKNILQFLLDTPAWRERRIAKPDLREIRARKVRQEGLILKPEKFFAIEKELDFVVKEAGIYDVIIHYCCHGDSRVQAACQIKMNGEILSLLQMNGTEEQWQIRKIARVCLQEGTYEVKVENLKAGIEIDEIQFAGERKQSS